jgi:hypothetical protein
MGAKVMSGRRNGTVLLFREEDSQEQVIEASQSLTSPSFSYASIVFSQGDVPMIMQTVLDFYSKNNFKNTLLEVPGFLFAELCGYRI